MASLSQIEAARLITPTGAAIVAELAPRLAMPKMKIEKIGYGVGTRDPRRA